jgi:transcriptional regulator with XRE-family HTH domain
VLSDHLGPILKSARKQLSLSREELASRAQVSPRLVAELERSQRPNVSLETALRLLSIVGVSLVIKAPSRLAAEIRGDSTLEFERAARAARAARRRETWQGRHVYMHDAGNDPRPPRSKAKRLAAVAQVSKQAYVVAGATRAQTKASKAKRSRA